MMSRLIFGNFQLVFITANNICLELKQLNLDSLGWGLGLGVILGPSKETEGFLMTLSIST